MKGVRGWFLLQLGMLLGTAWAGHTFTDYGCAPTEDVLQEGDEELLRTRGFTDTSHWVGWQQVAS